MATPKKGKKVVKKTVAKTAKSKAIVKVESASPAGSQ